ncbi:hypothetical protein IG206_00230 [Candidatus Parvarchaeota archaeon]|nr:hypothetical protein [Candidatus Acidifodinimicrobium mancum]
MAIDYNQTMGHLWWEIIEDETLDYPDMRETWSLLKDVSNGRMSWDMFNLRWVKLIAKKHISEERGSNFWIERASANGITAKKIDDTKSLDELVKVLGYADYDKLKQEDGYEKFYKPKDISISDLYRSESSGTTGTPKTVYHGSLPLTFSALDEVIGIVDTVPQSALDGKKLLCLGPKGAYQQEHRILAEILNMNYVDLSFDTKGLKNKPPEEVNKVIGPVIENTLYQLMDGNVGVMTGTPQTLYNMPKDLIEGVKVIKMSGVEINAYEIQKLESEFGEKGTNFIPMYGHFAGKSSIGKLNNNSIEYFPPYPFTIYKFGDSVDYGQRGRTELIVAQPELLLIQPEDYGKKVKSDKIFKGIDGIADPSR